MLKLKWLIAHQPAYLFVRTAKAFSEELEKRCPGEFDIEILTMKEYIEKYDEVPELRMTPAIAGNLEESIDKKDFFKKVAWADIKQKWAAYFEALKNGTIDISQTQITVIGAHLFRPFAILDLPFLFRDHDHVTNTLDYTIGKKLRRLIEYHTGIKSLGFTYSGGYRIIGSNHDIENIVDLKDTPLQTVPNTTEMWNGVGSKAFKRTSLDIEQTNDLCKEQAAVETTYLRFSGTNILKTNHSMFLTSILTGSSLFEKLNARQKKAFEESAYAVSKIERKWSLEDCEKYERDAESKGIQIREITPEQTQTLRDNAYKAYDNFYDLARDEYGRKARRQIVDEIQQVT